MFDPSWAGTRVECLAYYDMVGRKGIQYGRRKMLEVSHGTWLIPGKRTKCYKKNEAGNVLWVAVEEANCPQCKSIEEFCLEKFNKDCERGWRKEVEVNYGI